MLPQVQPRKADREYYNEPEYQEKHLVCHTRQWSFKDSEMSIVVQVDGQAHARALQCMSTRVSIGGRTLEGIYFRVYPERSWIVVQQLANILHELERRVHHKVVKGSMSLLVEHEANGDGSQHDQLETQGRVEADEFNKGRVIVPLYLLDKN